MLKNFPHVHQPLGYRDCRTIRLCHWIVTLFKSGTISYSAMCPVAQLAKFLVQNSFLYLPTPQKNIITELNQSPLQPREAPLMLFHRGM